MVPLAVFYVVVFVKGIELDDLTAGESDPWVQGRPAVGAIGEFEGSASAFDPHHSDDVLDPLL